MAVSKTARVAAGIVSAALVASGCTFLRQVSRPVSAAAGGAIHRPAVSADGRYIAYTGRSDVTAPGLPWGVYRYDTITDTRVRVSVAYPGWVPDPGSEPPNLSYPDDFSYEPAISADGRYVAFASDATNLVVNDTNDSADVFVRDLVANTTTRVSVLPNGTQTDDDSYTPSISANGRIIAFISDSDELSTKDDNLSADAYVRDLTANTMTLASVGSVTLEFGITEAVLSGNGIFVAFTTDTDLGSGDDNWSDDVYVRNLSAKTTTRITKPKVANPDDGGGDQPSMSYDGRYVAFVGSSDIDGAPDPYWGGDVFVNDTVARTMTRVSLGPTGGYLDGFASDPTLSSDGRRVIFRSTGNATGTDTNGAIADAYVRDLDLGRNYLVSTDMFGVQQSAPAAIATISGDGRYAAFLTRAGLSGDDTNNSDDVYIRATDIPTASSVSPATAARGSTVTMTVNGTSFKSGVNLVPLTTAYTVGPATLVSEKKFTVSVTISPSAPTGLMTLYVKNPGTGPGINGGAVGECANCLRIT